MKPFDGAFVELCPAPPHWDVPWTEIREAFAWVGRATLVVADADPHGR